ncbi:MAG: SDR family oxidoreductase [Myxococcota bacterium]
MTFELHGRRALVTGGTRGIGAAIAKAFISAGAKVSVVGRRPPEKDFGAAFLPADLSDGDAVDRLSEDDFEILVSCAGASHSAPAAKTKRADIDAMMSLHFQSALELARGLHRRRKGQGGAVLFVTSVWGLGGQPGTLAYGTAKAAMAHAVKVLAVEWARDGIRVNGLAPGFVDTDMTDAVGPDVREKLLRRVPMRRAAKPEEMAGPALLLCSDAGSYITGQIIVADGGERAR